MNNISFGEMVDAVAHYDIFETSGLECQMYRFDDNKVMMIVSCDSKGNPEYAMVRKGPKIERFDKDLAKKLSMACRLKVRAAEREKIKFAKINEKSR